MPLIAWYGPFVVHERPLDAGEHTRRRDARDRDEHRRLVHPRVVAHERTQQHDDERGARTAQISGAIENQSTVRARSASSVLGADHLPAPARRCGDRRPFRPAPSGAL